MTFDLCNVRKATNGETEELPIECASDRLADGGFPDTGRTHETDDLTLDRTSELADRKELQDAVLDVLQAIMVFV